MAGMIAQRCSRCKTGQVYDEDGDLVCLQCGGRDVEAVDPRMRINGQHEASGPVMDPFAQIVLLLKKAQQELTKDVNSTKDRLTQRLDQIKRMDGALRVLTKGYSPTPPQQKELKKEPWLACGHYPRQAEHKACIAAREGVTV